MKRIERYNEIKMKVKEAKEWASMLGKAYKGGGGGIGKLHSIGVDAKIYYQESNGDTNYHQMPSIIKSFMEDIIKDQFDELLQKAISNMEQSVKEEARSCVDEYKKYMLEAGILEGDL